VDTDIASAPRLCGLEKWADKTTACKLHEVLVEQFIASLTTAPEELVLDFDATDKPLYGQQEGRFFHGYYDSFCYLPLYVFCGQQLLCAYLRPSRIDGAKHAAAILQLLVKRLRQQWPQVRIVFRGDSGFCRQRIIDYCGRAGVHYIIGLARNAPLQAITEFMELAMKDAFEQTKHKQREIGQFMYAAQSWAKKRRVITPLEYGQQGNNPRYVVTNLTADPQVLCDEVYCQRGEAENRIRQAQVGLFATRTSCQQFQSNRLRMLLAALGYVLIDRLRALALKGTKLATAQVDTAEDRAAQTRSRRHPQYPAHSSVSGLQLALCRCLCARHGPITLTVDSHTAPGPRDDTNMARNPSRGWAHCACGAATATQSLRNSANPRAGCSSASKTE
jgi:hypothetical protein